MMQIRYTDGYYRMATSWLRGTKIGAALLAIGAATDNVRDQLLLGVYSRFPGYRPELARWDDPGLLWDAEGLTWGYDYEGAIKHIARDRGVARGWNEPYDNYCSRVLSYLDLSREKGNVYSLLRQIQGYHSVNPFPVTCVSRAGLQHYADLSGVITRTQLAVPAAWNPDAYPENFARLWLYYDLTSAYYGIADDGVWGDPGVWGDGGTWGSTLLPEEVAGFKAAPRDWLAAHIGECNLTLQLSTGDISMGPI